MPTLSTRVSDGELKAITEYANVSGMSVSDLMKKVLIHKICWLIKESVRYALNDLRLVSETANHKQIKEMFQITPFVLTERYRESTKSRNDITEQERKILKDERLYTSLDIIIDLILKTPKPKDEDDLWKTILVREIVKVCVEYLKQNDFLMTKSHLRLLEELEDLIDAIVGVSATIPLENRIKMKF